MIPLLSAESRRLLSRGTTRWIAVAGVIFLVLVSLMALRNMRPPSPEQLAANQQAYRDAQADWAKNGAQQIKDCEESNKVSVETGSPTMDCSQLAPQPAWFSAVPHRITEMTDMTPAVMTFALGGLWLIVAASFVGSEFTTGSISTWLLVEPRRTRVFWSKLLALGGVAAVSSVLSLCLTLVAWWVVGRVDRFDFTMTTAEQTAFLRASGMMVVTVTLAAMAIGATAFLLRSAAATFAGLGLFTILTSWLAGTTRFGWLSMAHNLYGFVMGHVTYSYSTCGGPQGCTYVERPITQQQAGLYLMVVWVALVALGWLAFHRRDVA